MNTNTKFLGDFVIIPGNDCDLLLQLALDGRDVGVDGCQVLNARHGVFELQLCVAARAVGLET